MIDTHCHLTYDGLSERVDQVIGAANAAGVDTMICVGTTPEDGQRAIALAGRFPGVYAAVGLHPHYALDWSDGAAVRQSLRALAANPKVVALGEMGLDRHYPDPPQEVQRRAFEWQLQLAAELDAGSSPSSGNGNSGGGGVSGGLPLIIHNREATADTLAMIRASGLPGGRFVFHCFTGSDAELDGILGVGAMVSVTGIVTFKNAKALAASAARVPLDRLMVETDSPYLAPEPHRKVKVNEPRYVVDVASFLAAQRGMDEREFIAAVDANARRFFRLA